MRDTTEDLRTLEWVGEGAAGLLSVTAKLGPLNFEYSGEKLIELNSALEGVIKKANKLIKKEKDYAKNHSRVVADSQDQG